MIKRNKGLICFVLLCVLSRYSNSTDVDWLRQLDEPWLEQTTFDRALIEAHKGDEATQNLIGYMLFFGETVEQDLELAHFWFHKAAEAGNKLAQRNLGLFHAGLHVATPAHFIDNIEANYWLQRANNLNPYQPRSDFTPAITFYNSEYPSEVDKGEALFQTYCSGCHGIDGHGSYSLVPSFKTTNVMSKTDEQLALSIKGGLDGMQGWQGVLSDQMILATIAYLRQQFNANSLVAVDDNDLDASLSKSNLKNQFDSTLSLGAQIYSKFCAGCHGFNGIAYFLDSPSFALGQRLEKNDVELKLSIEQGINMMPDWGNKISPEQISAALAYIRTFESQFNAGIERPLNSPLSHFYRFRPKQTWIRPTEP
ncbi:c-type cytochrome [Thalassotalea aquiviva]|uniref:c-type cytochrome n=1 Tax=Thalassotalea aquiviva TaxID=3242415 RepID=UPI003529DEB7